MSRRKAPGPREVVAELVQTPTAVSGGTPALTPPTNGSRASVLAEPVEVVFDSAFLRPRQDDASATTAVIEPEVATAAEAPAEIEEFCQIALWRGYAKSRFYARLEFAESDEVAVGESELFGLRGKGVPARTKASDAAHRALVENLVEEGWEPLPGADPWYATRFRRLVAVNDSEYALDL